MKQDGQIKRRPWIEFALISTIITLAVVIIFFISMNGNFKFQKTTTTASATDHVKESVSITDSEFPDIRIVTERNSGTNMTYNISYPKTTFDNVNQEITQYITTSKDIYQSELKNSEMAKGDLHIEVALAQYQSELYSITLKNNITIDDRAHNTSIQTYLFNKTTGEFISTKELLNDNELYLNILAKYVKSQLLANNNYSNYLYSEKLIEKTAPQWENFNRVAMNEDTFTFYFNKGEIADPIAGLPTITIPVSFMNPILAETYQNGETINTNILTPYDINTKRVALTFDDGPHPTVTPQILNLLDKYNAKATFFMLGQRVQNSPDIAKDVWNRGHEVGNHTWGHPVLTRIGDQQILEEFNSTSNIIHETIGQYPSVFRPPYGAINDHVTSMLNLPVIMWSIDTLDWKHRNANQLLTYVQYGMHNNAIILMHDIHQSTADGLESVLAYLQQQGYQFVTVSDILLIEQLNQ